MWVGKGREMYVALEMDVWGKGREMCVALEMDVGGKRERDVCGIRNGCVGEKGVRCVWHEKWMWVGKGEGCEWH